MGEGGIKPVRASGSRWVSHKLIAIKRIISKYGAYTSHLLALSEGDSGQLHFTGPKENRHFNCFVIGDVTDDIRNGRPTIASSLGIL